MPATRHTFAVCLLLSIAACIAPAAHAQTFDPDGGWQQSPCNGGATGYFYTEKVGNRWWFCTPEGNHFHANSLAAMEVPGINANTIWASSVAAKYGSNNTGAQDTLLKFMKQGGHAGNYGFNTVGEDSNGMLPPWTTTCTGCITVPGLTDTNVSVYSTVNRSGFASHPIKNYRIGLNGYNVNAGLPGCTDFFDPQYPVFVSGFFTQGQSNLSNAHSLGVMIDDTDFECGMGASDAFDTSQAGHQKANLAYVVLTTSPIETLNPGQGNTSYQSTPELFADAIVYAKHLSASPPTSLVSCWSLANKSAAPCSLPDYLNAEYGGAPFPACAAGAAPDAVDRLNKCWGSTYTTMGSSGTASSQFLCGTGDGATVLFTCTLPTPSGPISPLSIAVYQKTGSTATMIGGDCAWWENCPQLTNPPKPYNCTTVGACKGTIQGDSASPLLSGSQPFLSDNPCGAAGANPLAPHASFAAIVIWHGPGSYIPSRQTGENCAAGEGDTVKPPTNTPPAGVTGFDVYMSCQRKDSTTPGFGCVGSSTTQPAPTLQATDIGLTTTFTVPSTGLVSGSALPSPPSFIDYGTGAVTLTFETAPPSGTTVTINSVSGGWMWGTGLEDEDGRNSWMDGGINPFCLLAYNGTGGPGTDGYACRPGNTGGYPTSNINQNAAADLSNWLYQAGAQYFSTVRNGLKASFPHALFLGPNTLSDWGTPAHRQLLQVAADYLDLAFVDVYNAMLSDDAVRVLYLEQYFDDHPFMDEVFVQAAADSAVSSCSSCVSQGFTTQAARGAAYYGLVNACLNNVGFSGDFPCVGFDWWGMADFNAPAETNNWGLVTPSDNDYNGSDPSATTATCTVFTSMTCGNEPAPGTPAGRSAAVRPFGDALTGPAGVIAANQLWFQGRPTVPSKKSAIFARLDRPLIPSRRSTQK